MNTYRVCLYLIPENDEEPYLFVRELQPVRALTMRDAIVLADELYPCDYDHFLRVAEPSAPPYPIALTEDDFTCHYPLYVHTVKEEPQRDSSTCKERASGSATKP